MEIQIIAGIFSRGRIYTDEVRLRGLLKPTQVGLAYIEAVSNRPFH